MARDSSGGALIAAALLLAGSVLGAGYFMSQSIDRGTAELGELTAAVIDMPNTPAAAAPTNRAARSNRPDPNRRYNIALAGAPTKGAKKNPAVTIVEWSDFQ